MPMAACRFLTVKSVSIARPVFGIVPTDVGREATLRMSIFERGKKPVHIPTIAREVFDVTGAGDTVIATAALAMLGGLSIREAAVMANAAAGVVVGKIGTATCAPEELLAAVEDH